MHISKLAVRPEWSAFYHEGKRSRNDARNEFQRDRDRILYSSAFRRLAGKTQVFRAGGHDHIRTRLTHTLEVAQIARTIARQLGLNEDLVEAIALGHDLGHTPFGHVGEDVLKLISSGCDRLGGMLKDWHFEEGKRGFKHNLQSLRVALELEKAYSDHSGLNLSGFVLWGIVYHSKLKWKNTCKRVHYCRFNRDECSKEEEERDVPFALDFYDGLLATIPGPMGSLEAFVVNQADEIAQRHHDLEDGIHARIIARPEAVNTVKSLVAGAGMEDRHGRSLETLDKSGDMSSITFTGELARVVVDVLVTRLVDESKKRMDRLSDELRIGSADDYRKWLSSEPIEKIIDRLKETISYSESFSKFEKEMSKSSYSRIMNSNLAQRMDGKGRFILRQLFKAYIANPQQLPDRTILYFVESIPHNPFRSLLEADDLNFREKIGKIRQKLDDVLGSKDFRDVHKALARGICDYLAGMTDDMAMEEHRKLYSAHEEMKALR